jgi:hypothetical protein
MRGAAILVFTPIIPWPAHIRIPDGRADGSSAAPGERSVRDDQDRPGAGCRRRIAKHAANAVGAQDLLQDASRCA